MKIALGIEYNGSKFHGWQAQNDVMTLQATLESALSKVANEPIKVVCAGRTDAGVHATNQVVHFESQAKRKTDAWILGTNSYLSSSMSVQWAKEIDDSFHARFSALSRRYQYLIYNKPVRSSLFSAFSTWINYPLDEKKMALAAKTLIGEHDFTSFRSADCQSKTPLRHVFAATVSRREDFVILDIVANSFLHHMVRNIMGVLIEIGSNRKDTSWCLELLEAKNRKLASKTAPPQGLYLTGVRYADTYNISYDYRSPSFLI